jgi:Sporulation protein YhaL
MLSSLPWWIYLVVAGIIFSGYMTVRTAAQEREIDQTFIEKEGEIYMERIRKERERRQQAKSL